MTTDEGGWRRLADVVRKRRQELGLYQGDLKARGGPGEDTVHNVETVKRDRYTPRTFRELEWALRFPEGTLRRVVSGEVVEGSPELSTMVVGPRTPEERIAQAYEDGVSTLQDKNRAPRDMADEDMPIDQRARAATGALARALDALTLNGLPEGEDAVVLDHILTALAHLRAPTRWDPTAARFWVQAP